jgi:hypothetical protein
MQSKWLGVVLPEGSIGVAAESTVCAESSLLALER